MTGTLREGSWVRSEVGKTSLRHFWRTNRTWSPDLCLEGTAKLIFIDVIITEELSAGLKEVWWGADKALGLWSRRKLGVGDKWESSLFFFWDHFRIWVVFLLPPFHCLLCVEWKRLLEFPIRITNSIFILQGVTFIRHFWRWWECAAFWVVLGFFNFNWRETAYQHFSD